MPETPYRSSNKSHNHCVFLLGGCLAERAFFQKHLLWSMYIYIYIYMYMSGLLLWQISDQKNNNKLHSSSVRNREAFRSIPSAEDIETKIVHGRSMVRTRRRLFSPRSSQGTNYPLRGQAHVNPAAGRIVPSREHVHIPTERGKRKSSALLAQEGIWYMSHCLAGILFLLVFVLCFTPDIQPCMI